VNRVFKVTTVGTLTTLHNFQSTDGAYPEGHHSIFYPMVSPRKNVWSARISGRVYALPDEKQKPGRLEAQFRGFDSGAFPQEGHPTARTNPKKRGKED